jgi:hypothetical protein
VIRIHPEGGVQIVGGRDVCEAIGRADAVSEGSIVSVGVSLGRTVMIVAVGVGKLSGNVGGMGVGVAGVGKVSARERKIPPMTKITEKIAMITPAPNWRRACIISSPSSLEMSSWQSAAEH